MRFEVSVVGDRALLAQSRLSFVQIVVYSRIESVNVKQAHVCAHVYVCV